MVLIIIANYIDLYMLYLYVDVVIGFMKFLNFKSNSLRVKVFKIILYFGGIPLGIIRVIAIEYIYWAWAIYIFGDIS